MEIIEWFDPYNVEHVKAYEHMIETGVWPKDFIPEGITFPTGWCASLNYKMAAAWAVLVTEQEKLKEEREKEGGEHKIYKKAPVAFQKLSPKKGDIILIRFPDDIDPAQMALAAGEIQEHIPDNIIVLCLRQGVSVSKLPEAQMNKHGWYKFDKETQH